MEGQGQSCPHLPESPAGGKGPSQVPSRGSSSRVRPDDSGASSVPAAGGTRRVRPPPYSPGFLAPPGQGQVLGKQPGTREDRLSVFTAISVPAASDHYSGANPGFRPHLILTILKTVPPTCPRAQSASPEVTLKSCPLSASRAARGCLLPAHRLLFIKGQGRRCRRHPRELSGCVLSPAEDRGLLEPCWQQDRRSRLQECDPKIQPGGKHVCPAHVYSFQD